MKRASLSVLANIPDFFLTLLIGCPDNALIVSEPRRRSSFPLSGERKECMGTTLNVMLLCMDDKEEFKYVRMTLRSTEM